MIYLASDDRYFSLGVTALLSAMGKTVVVIDLAWVQETGVAPALSPDDTVLLAIEHAGTFTRWLSIVRRCGSKVLLVMEHVCQRRESPMILRPMCILPKNMPILYFPRLFDAGVTCQNDLSFLTYQEVSVMRGLACGKTPFRIARELNVTMKTVCSHKYNAIKKLGLSHLNSRSLLIFRLLFEGGYPRSTPGAFGKPQ